MCGEGCGLFETQTQTLKPLEPLPCVLWSAGVWSLTITMHKRVAIKMHKWVACINGSCVLRGAGSCVVVWSLTTHLQV